MRSAEVVIAGGGATGSSVAAHLLVDPDFHGRVIVIERDPTYRLAASALSAASIRQQYSQPVNVRLSMYGIAYLRSLAARPAPDDAAIGLHEGGYLYLADERGAPVLRANHDIQRREGADIVLLDAAALAGRFPWLDLSGVTLGSFGRSGEGWFDGWALLQEFRRTARRNGADYVTGDVVGVEREGNRISAVRLRDGERIGCAAFVNCAGSNGSEIARMAGIAIPVQAKRRTVFTFTCGSALSGFPLMIDTTGVWIRPEGSGSASGQTYICGWSPPADSDPDWRDDDPDSQALDWPLFEEVVWPALASRVPAFESIRPGRAWAGPYDMNLLDHNAILGPAASCENLYLCNGFSGHGLQHAAGVGRGLAELIVHGRYVTLDLSDFGHDRIARGRPLIERNVI